jgi:cation diffusion facilitator family transporter
MMLGEVVAGLAFGSMALLADGWHMGTHAAALGVATFAYAYARRHAHDPRFSFGTGKVGALGGFASAVGLAVIALLVLTESVVRLASPVTIRFDEAIAVCFLGLVVNIVCALLLREHEHDADDAHHRDHNRRAAYVHVLADALTSVFALIALFSGKWLGWPWMDPIMGIAGAIVIAWWSAGLLRDTSAVLLDAEGDAHRREAIRAAIESDGRSRIVDLHLWRVGPRHLAVIVTVATSVPREPEDYRQALEPFRDLAHVTVEVRAAAP